MSDGEFITIILDDVVDIPESEPELSPPPPPPSSEPSDTWMVITGKSEDVLVRMPDNSVDAVVCDPPYGLSKEPDIYEVLQHWLNGDDYESPSKGFMGAAWDSFVPGPRLWKEVCRVLKPGGHALIFAGSRTFDLMSIAVRMGGFEIRDALQWIYGSGMPKGLNVSRAIQKQVQNVEPEAVIEYAGSQVGGWNPSVHNETRNRHVMPEPEGLAAQWEGWSTALKPAYEPILLARKPLGEKSVAANVVKYGTGAINVDATRVGTEKRVNPPWGNDGSNPVIPRKSTDAEPTEVQGRWPANVLLGHHPECVEIGTVQGDGYIINRYVDGAKPFGEGAGHPYTSEEVSGQEESVWDCAEDCPVRMMDDQSGISGGGKTGKVVFKRDTGGVAYHFNVQGHFLGEREGYVYGDKGGASRYFTRFLYHPKASTKEREEGLDAFDEYLFVQGNGGQQAIARGETEYNVENQSGFNKIKKRKNVHPTVKPIAVMQWLVRLITPPGGIVLDPFTGSGSTGCAAVYEGFGFVGIEMDDMFAEIARARIAHWEQKRDQDN